LVVTIGTLERDIPTVAGLRWRRGLRASRHNVQQLADETERIDLSVVLRRRISRRNRLMYLKVVGATTEVLVR
jgi:hypothetical protein